MKVLIWSDIHLHNWPYGSKLVDGVNSRLLAGREVMHQIAQYIQENDIDHVVFCGDLFHTHGILNEQVLKVAYEGIKEIQAEGLDMDMLVGNHDTGTKDMSTHSLHWLNGIDGVRVIDKPTHDPNGRFSYLPYTEDVEVLKKFFAEAGQYCFMHQGMVDVPMASGFVINEILNYDMIPDHVRHVFTGHYHPLKYVGVKATNVGSVMQHTWADLGDIRGFVVFDTETLEIIQYAAQLHTPEFRMLDMQGCSSLGKDGAMSATAGILKNNYIRVKNFEEGSIENLRKEILAEGAASVEFIIKPKAYKSTVVKAISGKGLNVPELVREYEDEHSISQERRKVGKELMV